MHLQLRSLAVPAALLLGALVAGWGIAASVRPELWGGRAVRWCVGWTPEPVGRTFGVAVATFGAGIVVSGVACALMPPEAAIPPLARLVQLTGLGLLVLSGGALLSTHPAPIAETGTPRPPSPVGDPIQASISIRETTTPLRLPPTPTEQGRRPGFADT